MKLFNTIILAAGLSAVSALPTVIKRDFVVVNCNDRQIKMLNQARRLCQERGISARDVAYSYESG
jgi:AraC-like DNA-binding protein